MEVCKFGTAQAIPITLRYFPQGGDRAGCVQPGGQPDDHPVEGSGSVEHGWVGTPLHIRLRWIAWWVAHCQRRRPVRG